MDEMVKKWILRFLQRNPTMDDKIILDLLKCLPFSDKDTRLKKTQLLRILESEISTGSISEELLEILEIMADLDHEEGKTSSDSIREAYCSVAVNCTVRLLKDNQTDFGEYYKALERVWTERACLKGALVSMELFQSWMDINAVVWISSARNRILSRNTWDEALEAVTNYLQEGWKTLGPPDHKLVSSKVEELHHGGGGNGASSENPPCREMVSTHDPLPEALQTVETLCSTELATKPDNAVENQARAETLVAHEKAKKKHNFIATAQGHKTHDAAMSNLENPRKKDKLIRYTQSQPNPNHSLIEPSDTEWDDSIVDRSRSQHVTSYGLPSSSSSSTVTVTVTVTPSKPHVNKSLWRRESQKWTPKEEEALRNGVMKYGKRWKLILEEYADAFSDRRGGDLKDKWRNMLKYSET